MLQKNSEPERLLTGSTSNEKFQEITTFIADLKLEQSSAVVRIFNSGLLENMRRFGTDRAGIDEVDIRSYQSEKIHGYDEELRRMGLRLDDGMFASFFDRFAERFSPEVFEEIIIGISPHRIALAVYRADLMRALSEQFFYFVDPSQKRHALAGILLQPPLPIEQEFVGLSLEAKETFLQEGIGRLNRENIAIYLELAKDMVSFTNINRLVESAERAQSIFDMIEQREIEMNVIDECLQQVDLLRKIPNHVGTSTRLIADHIHQWLHNGVSTAGETELLQVLRILDDIG